MIYNVFGGTLNLAQSQSIHSETNYRSFETLFSCCPYCSTVSVPHDLHYAVQ